MNSADHFQGVVVYLIASINKMLSAGNTIHPIGLAVSGDKSVELITAAVTIEKIVDKIDSIQKKMQSKANDLEITISCIAYPEYEKNQVVAFIENNENYCIKIIMPVMNRNGLKVNAEKIITKSSSVYVFPVKQLH